MSKAKRETGFSLLELLIVVAIATTLTTLAVSSYRKQMIREVIVQGQSDLLALAAKMEAFRLENGSYIGAAGSEKNQTTTGEPWISPSYSPSSSHPDRKSFELHIRAATEFSYELVATSVVSNGQSLMYTSAGEKYWDRNGNGEFEQSEACWQCN